MSDSGKSVEISFDCSADNIPDALREAAEKSGMGLKAYMDEAAENIQCIVTLLKSCVDLYKDKKTALEYLGFSFVSGVTVFGGTDSHVSVSKVMCGDAKGILCSIQSLAQEMFEDVCDG